MYGTNLSVPVSNALLVPDAVPVPDVVLNVVPDVVQGRVRLPVPAAYRGSGPR